MSSTISISCNYPINLAIISRFRKRPYIIIIQRYIS